jgi:hypothetical protein
MNIAIILFLIVAIILAIIFTPSVNLRFLLLMIRPFQPFGRRKEPPAPDYANPGSWAALPSMKSITDCVPVDILADKTIGEKPADVFYLHRTTLLSPIKWNANIRSRGLNRLTDRTAIRNQAGIFNESCRIFAPRYRQATLYAFFDKTGSGRKALDLAYRDVKEAFEYYLEHFHDGRPMVIAGHSQGAEHASHLLKDFFDGRELAGKLVVAYLPGMPYSADTFHDIKPSAVESQNRCFASWSTFGWGVRPNYFQEGYRTAICTNPLTWNKDEVFGDFSRHKGSVSPGYKRIDPNLLAAQCAEGVLWVRNRKPLRYMPLPLKNYVVMDFDLFYMDVRENVKKRISNHLKSIS